MPALVACKTCGLMQRLADLSPGTIARCARCGWRLAKVETNALGRTAAFALAALILYFPANIYPILQMDLYGVHSESTVWEGCQTLFQEGEFLIAVIVFLASILIPFLKLVGLLTLVAATKLNLRRWRQQRTWVYRFLDAIGPWAMLDVFLLAVLVALVRLGEIATVLPGPGLVAFTAVVVLTILATSTFDPILIWQDPEART
jgi:paraquat-inducible protein A